jgi:hypothetical protein
MCIPLAVQYKTRRWGPLFEFLLPFPAGEQDIFPWPHCSHSRDNLLSVFWKHIFFLINFAIIFTKKLKIKLHKNCICMHIYVMPTYIYTFRYYIIIYNYTCAMYKIYIVFNFYICINNPLFIYSKEILRFLFSLYIFLLSLYIYIHTHTQSNWQKIHHIILIHISSFDN